MRTFKVNVNGVDYDVKIEEIGGNYVQGYTAPVSAPAAPVAPIAPVAPVAPVAPSAPAEPEKQPVADTPKKSSGTQGGTKINSPFPGTVLKINVKQGDAVKKGDVLCVIEAMKMENDISSPCDGTVASIDVNLGANVSTDELILSLN